MLVAISTAATVWWWIGLAVVFLVVIPLLLVLAWRLVQVVAEIRRYADDIRTHGGGLADELGAVVALRETQQLTAALRGGLARYAAAVGRILSTPGGRP